MGQQQFVMYQAMKYLLLGTKGDFVTICNGDYSHLGENAITVKKEDVQFL